MVSAPGKLLFSTVGGVVYWPCYVYGRGLQNRSWDKGSCACGLLRKFSQEKLRREWRKQVRMGESHSGSNFRPSPAEGVLALGYLEREGCSGLS